jgi:hypothetical protein
VTPPLSRVVRAPLPSPQGIAGTIARQRATRNPAAAPALMTCARAGELHHHFASCAAAVSGG